MRTVRRTAATGAANCLHLQKRHLDVDCPVDCCSMAYNFRRVAIPRCMPPTRARCSGLVPACPGSLSCCTPSLLGFTRALLRCFDRTTRSWSCYSSYCWIKPGVWRPSRTESRLDRCRGRYFGWPPRTSGACWHWLPERSIMRSATVEAARCCCQLTYTPMCLSAASHVDCLRGRDQLRSMSFSYYYFDDP